LFAAVVSLLWEERQIRRRHEVLAASRQPLTDEEFLVEMEHRGVSRKTAEYLRSWLEYAYRDSLKPDPDDRIFSDLQVLAEDSGDLVTEYFEAIGQEVSDDLDAFQLHDPSLAELGNWLQSLKK
jgi:hypothetical protein